MSVEEYRDTTMEEWTDLEIGNRFEAWREEIKRLDEGSEQRQDDERVLQWLERLESPEEETSGVTIPPA
ncbi:MAG: hypothetical protein Q9203_003469 [Teloschistes exilis]